MWYKYTGITSIPNIPIWEDKKMNPIFEKVRTKKVYMEIVEQIQNLIKEGRLKKGDKLPPERVLAEQLGVSRAPLR
jgi:GntR family transcriptional repressor for pyruvate dehydrogenase complex